MGAAKHELVDCRVFIFYYFTKTDPFAAVKTPHATFVEVQYT